MITQQQQDCFTLMVLRQFSDRISDALLFDPSKETTWEKIDNLGGTSRVTTKTCSSCCVTAGDTNSSRDCDDRVTVIEVPSLKHGRRDTKFNILIVRNLHKRPLDLPPIARQQISWCHKIDYECVVDPISIDSQNDQFITISRAIYECFRNKSKDHYLRVDTFPKKVAPLICRALQRHACSEGKEIDQKKIDENDPFSGPLNFTLSASRANYIISVIEVIENRKYMFGIATNDEHWSSMNSKFNDAAAGDVWIEPTNPQTGIDLNPLLNIKDFHAPVSRAYYKLDQIFDDYPFPTINASGSGIDLGSSPGGWTQILHARAKLSKVLSIDPGILAHRVENLTGVKHCKHDFTSESAQQEMICCSPFSHVVCDASTNASEVFSKIVGTFDKVYEKLKSENNGMLLTLPSQMIVTIKMPYKTAQSQNRILKKIGDELPSIVATMKKWSGSEDALFKVVHQMANSDNERTVIILFR
jgi:hypothetical protein